ncbi:DUF3761 domain-containing protein [Streptomyces alkaliphilus]|uniref:DUF3761 domain-containing protein n=1 Tax=Streptomyces alkaliphilus TaxID=1472722 RepID=A0A7W3Y3M5_9ACTN|nr:DUF3761 domain-containing protein [Streptomyces alkaliphilus]
MTTTVTETVTRQPPPPAEPPVGATEGIPSWEEPSGGESTPPPGPEEDDGAGLMWGEEDGTEPLPEEESGDLVEPAAWCNDGTLVFVERRRGACEAQGGVAVWLRFLPH